jgi:hypothetical protein
VYNNERISNNHPSARTALQPHTPSKRPVLLEKTAVFLSKGPAPHPQGTIRFFTSDDNCSASAQIKQGEKVKK